MSTITEIQEAIEQLSVADRLRLMEWLNLSEDDDWDRQMKRDAHAGKFSQMAKEAETAYREGRTIEFP